MTDGVAASGDYEEYQISLPASFQSLYADVRGRLQSPLAHVRARYEWCEDLAQLLVESMRMQPQDGWQDQQHLLQHCREGLGDGGTAGAATQSAGEADWIVQRLAELLGWSSPQPSKPEN